jgi:hypothetical protein
MEINKMNTTSEQPQPRNNRTEIGVWFLIGVISIVITLIIGINDNIPGILLLLLGSFALVYAFFQFVSKSKNLSPEQQLLYWSPRVLSIVFIAFTCIFALDVFGESRGFGETILALLMHLIPQFLMIGVLILSWRREWIGGVVFILLAILYIVGMWGRFPLMTYVIISGPLALTGILFLLNWRYRKSLRVNAKG